MCPSASERGHQAVSQNQPGYGAWPASVSALCLITGCRFAFRGGAASALAVGRFLESPAPAGDQDERQDQDSRAGDLGVHLHFLVVQSVERRMTWLS